MGFWLVLFFFGIPAYCFFTDGKTGSGWACVVIIAIAFLLHLGWLRDLHAWNNFQNYWAYGWTDWGRRRRVRYRKRAERHVRNAVTEQVLDVPIYRCSECGTRMQTINRHYKLDDDWEVSIYRCPKCLKRMILNN